MENSPFCIDIAATCADGPVDTTWVADQLELVNERFEDGKFTVADTSPADGDGINDATRNLMGSWGVATAWQAQPMSDGTSAGATGA